MPRRALEEMQSELWSIGNGEGWGEFGYLYECANDTRMALAVRLGVVQTR